MMDLSFDYYLKLIDLPLVIMVLVIVEAVKGYVPERIAPMLPLLFGGAAALLSAGYDDTRALIKATIYYGGAASLLFKLGVTTLLGRGLTGTVTSLFVSEPPKLPLEVKVQKVERENVELKAAVKEAKVAVDEAKVVLNEPKIADKGDL